MRKRLFIFILLLTNIDFVCGQSYDFSAVCSTGQTLYYKINTGTTTVKVTSYSGSYSNLIIPSVVTNGSTSYIVTSIGNAAFQYSGLNTVTMPNTITSVNDWVS